MKKTVILIGAVLVLVLAVTPLAFAENESGSEDYETCSKVQMGQADLASFEEIIDELKAFMAKLRDEKDTFEERMQLKEEKKNDLLDIVPNGFEERFGGFSKNQRRRSKPA